MHRADFEKKTSVVEQHLLWGVEGIKPGNKEVKPGYLEIKRDQIRYVSYKPVQEAIKQVM